MSKITVIVPVYNVELYLDRCVQSILSQTYTDFELILVDDGSPDNCPAMCDEYARKDGRVHVIHQENGGLSAARNAGIDWAFANSDSEWITFIDSDDWVHLEYLERLLNAAIVNKVDISIVGFKRTEKKEPNIYASQMNVQLWRPEDFFVQHNTNATIACGKLYKKDCFYRNRYPIGKMHEDEYTTYKLIFSYDKLAVILAPLYFYFNNTCSITKTPCEQKIFDRIEAGKQQVAFFDEHHYLMARNKAANGILWITEADLKNRKELKGQKQIVKLLKKEMKQCLHEYKHWLSLSIHTHQGYYEAVYPHLMWIYWTCQSLLKKLKR